MFLSEYASEMEMVHQFVRYTHHHKIPVTHEKSLAFLVWGYEFWMPEGGKNGGSGSIDLLASDEEGHAWLIEAKLGGNPELSEHIWTNQILKYRSALARRSHDEISLRCRGLILNRWGDGTLVLPEIAEGCTRLLDAFVNWASLLGLGADAGHRIYDQTMLEVLNEGVVSVVLANDDRQNVWQSHPDDGRAYAYLVCSGRDANFIASCVGYTLPEQGQVDDRFHPVAEDWSDLLQARRVNATPDTVGQYLAGAVEPLFLECMQRLKDLGWDGAYRSNTKAFTVDMPTTYGTPVRIHLGWVDFDAPLAIKNRLPGEMGLKFNIDFRHFKREAPKIGYDLATLLATKAAYIGKGEGRAIGHRELTDDEKQSWDWEMFRWAARGNQDYLGSENELEDFRAAWTFLDSIVNRQR